MTSTSNYIELKELKKGDLGKGLLIENDGYITTSKETLNEAVNADGDEWNVPYPFIVNAVFQKYGIKNANGRIYPEEVLKREVERYQSRIRERRALGECYTEDAKILTYDGWKSIKDVREGELVLTLNTETNEIEIKPIIRKIEKDWDGELYSVGNKYMKDVVTPNHNFPIYSNKDNQFVGMYSAEDIKNNKVSSMRNCYISKVGNWVENGDDFFILKGISSENDNKWKEDIQIPMSTFMKFMGIYLSEGCVTKDNNYVLIYQKNEEKTEKIDELLQELNLEYKKEIRPNELGYVFKILDKRLKLYLEPLGDCYTKYIPTYLKNQSKENLKLLYEWFVIGDGRVRGDKREPSKENKRKNKSLTDDVFSTSERLILDLNEIQLKIGFNGHFHMEKRNNDRHIGDRLIEGKNCHPMYFSLRSLSKGIHLNPKCFKIEPTNYKGKVYCIEVENHTWFVMQNGRCHWTGNCNHPDASSIDLTRVSHNITELHWEGKTLVGQMEIFTSYGFRKHGIVTTCGDMVANLLLSGYKIGVSSRAIGSVEEKLGTLYVGNDLEIIAWDVVADPSTPNAYIYETDEEKSAYLESKEEDKSKSKLNEKISKLKDILK